MRPEPLQLDPANLPADVSVLRALVAQLIEQLQHSRDRNTTLERQVQLLVRKLYGVRSEKLDPHQQTLFDKDAAAEAPAAVPPAASIEEPPAAAVERRAVRKRRSPRPDTLERRDVIHDLTPAEKQALAGDGELVPLGEQITEQYEWEPSCLYVVRHIQKKYVRRPALLESGATPETKNILTAAKPPQPIPGGQAGPGLLAALITGRFCDHLPYYRQEQIFARHGLRFARQTTCDWARGTAELCRPLYELLIAEVLQSHVLHSDDTPVKVRDAHRKRNYTGRFWNYVGDEEHPFTVFAYTPDRSRDGPAEFLQNYRGYLQADAYSGYDPVYARPQGGIIEVACWAHARRNFFEARASDLVRAETALAFIRRLYGIERELKQRLGGEWSALSRTERAERVTAERQRQARPVLDEFGGWLEAQVPQVLPKHPLRQAIEYARNQWPALNRYCCDGRLAIDNNAAERAIRGIALGRKNWLFCGSDRGGATAAVHFSLIASCARHGVNPFGYLRALYQRLPELTATGLNPAELRELLPDRWRG